MKSKLYNIEDETLSAIKKLEELKFQLDPKSIDKIKKDLFTHIENIKKISTDILNK